MKKEKQVIVCLGVFDAEPGTELALIPAHVAEKKKGGLGLMLPLFEVPGKTMAAKCKALHAYVDDLFMAVALEKDVAKHKARLKPKG
jgi:hypothetical protein